MRNTGGGSPCQNSLVGEKRYRRTPLFFLRKGNHGPRVDQMRPPSPLFVLRTVPIADGAVIPKKWFRGGQV